MFDWGLGMRFVRQVLATAAFLALGIAQPAGAADFWDQPACVALGNTEDACTCTKGLLDEALKSSYPPEAIAALKEKGPDGLVGFLSDDDQLALLDNLTEVMESEAPKQCGYKDGHQAE